MYFTTHSLCTCLIIFLSFSFLFLALHTCLSVRSMSMPWFQGAAGFARQSPALPLREMSTFCLRRFLKASAITITPSYVRAEVYCIERRSGKSHRNAKHLVQPSFKCTTTTTSGLCASFSNSIISIELQKGKTSASTNIVLMNIWMYFGIQHNRFDCISHAGSIF